MSRINPVNTEKATPKVKEIFKQLESKLGKIPNLFLNMGNSEAVLQGYMNLNEAANHTSFDPKLREQIALIVSQTNNCAYCLSAHSAIAKGLGIQQEDILKAREGQATDPKSQAILKFAKTVVEKKGHVSEQDIATLKAAKVNDKELSEIMMLIILNMFTNYYNHVTDPKIDFPVAPELAHTNR
jgi:uncharacterized peroxidase-related enzyme